jgi:hypothetical protein
MIYLMSMPGGGEWLIIFLFFGGILFFIFKAGQWRGEAMKNRKNQKKDID